MLHMAFHLLRVTVLTIILPKHRAAELVWNMCAASRLSEARRTRQKLPFQLPPPQAAAKSAVARTQALLCFTHWARSCTTSAQMMLKAALTLTVRQALVQGTASCQCQVQPCRCLAAATSHVRWLTGWARQLDGSMSLFAMSSVHHHKPCDFSVNLVEAL